MTRRSGSFPALAFMAGLIFIAAVGSVRLMSQAAPASTVDPYDRGTRAWEYSRLASSGWERGSELFQVKCWMCHNEYTIGEERRGGGSPAPSLLPLYQSVNGDEQLAAQIAAVIRRGGLRMPAYSAATLSDQDLEDILDYMRHCGTTPRWCFDGSPSGMEHNPAANPWFVAQ
ncbi:cytochrome c [bacterium AH-315-O15]|nr:cytochrome c [bacterium AH-315-O15]